METGKDVLTLNGVTKSASPITEERLLEKFRTFHKDTRSLDAVQKWGYVIPGAELLVESFVADFSAESGVIGTDFYTRFTPVAKILAIGTDCVAPYKDLKVGSYVVVEDGIVGQTVNPDWEAHISASSNSNYSQHQDTPPKYITRHLKWIDQGWWFHPDKTELCLDSTFIGMWSSKGIGKFAGPYVFRRPASMCVPVRFPFGHKI